MLQDLTTTSRRTRKYSPLCASMVLSTVRPLPSGWKRTAQFSTATSQLINLPTQQTLAPPTSRKLLIVDSLVTRAFGLVLRREGG